MMGDNEDDRIKEGTKDSCWCEVCGLRRVIWPLHQNVSSWADSKVKWIHINGLGPCE